MLEENVELRPADEIRALLPKELVEVPKNKSKFTTSQGFAYKLWHFLKFAGQDRNMARNIGCGWISHQDFFIDKIRLCEIIQAQINTLNFKLRSCKFNQCRQRHSRLTFWTCENFTTESTLQDLEEIDNRRLTNDDCPSILIQAVYLPLLEHVRLYTTTQIEITKSKVESILLWEDIVRNNAIWAIDANEFIELASMKLAHDFIGKPNGDTFAFDASQTEFAQFYKTNNLDLLNTTRLMLKYVLIHENPRLITIKDFCNFFARFGPDECILEKIHQLLCCSQAFDDWFQPDEQKFDQSKSLTGSYSNTFANCFIIKRSQGASYHIYNLPFMNTRSGFLIDETGKKFLTWHAVFESFSVAPQQQMQYQAFTFTDNFENPI